MGLLIGTAFAQVVLPEQANFKHTEGVLIVAQGKKREFKGLEIIGGTLTNRGEMTVTKKFYWGSGAIFENRGTLILEGDVTIHVDMKPKFFVIPAIYGPRYTSTGVVLFGTGEVITATGSRTEWFTPSIGNLILK